MIKTYCFNHKVCEQIHGIVFATSLDKETTLEVVLKANECSKYFNIQNYITDLENMKYVDYEYWLDNRLSEIERDLGY